MLHSQLAWYVGGPVLSLCVVAWRAFFNSRLGVTGGVSEIIGKLASRSLDFDWRGWFAIGLVAGATAFALVVGGPTFHDYGWLTDTFHGSSRVWIGAILLVSGGLIGYGAKLSGGCTSGNGLSGTSILSPASLVATGTFFATAIVVSFLIEAVV
jgi:uncharacterized membrane protein YedE/YeeE